MNRRVVIAAVLLACVGAAPAQESRPETAPASRPLDPLRLMAARVAESVNLDPPGIPEDYSKEFLLAFPFVELRALLADYKFKHGPVRSIEELRRANDRTGVFRIVFERKVGMRMELMIKGEPPQVAGLLFSEALPEDDTREKAIFGLTTFHGRTAMALTTVPAEGPAKLFDGKEPDDAMAVAGAARLYVLGALIEEIAAGRRRWDEVVVLAPGRRAGPNGRLRTWPDGSPLTLQTLATLMTNDGDDTATELLLATLGRDRVEAMLSPMGVKDPASRLPFLSPREAFALKAEPGGAAAAAWLRLDAAGRRAALPALAATPPEALPAFFEPRYVDSIGWFASPREICDALVWILRRTESGPAAVARDVLGLNRGLSVDPAFFTFAGYNGGAEPGAHCAAWLLRRPDGRWFAFCAAWNDASTALDERRFLAWTLRYLELCAASL